MFYYLFKKCKLVFTIYFKKLLISIYTTLHCVTTLKLAKGVARLRPPTHIR